MSRPRRTCIALACAALVSVHVPGHAQSASGPTPAAAAASAPSAAAAPAPAGESVAEQLPIVEVTASKRRERSIDVPTALTALSSAQIQNLGLERFSDYASLVPNLVQVGGAAAGAGTVVMRGMYSGPQQTTNTTAIYLGETPVSSNGTLAQGSFFTPDLDLFEIERVEVLKGPQGTLYGATSLGGLLRIVPQLPDTHTFDGRARVGLSQVQDGGSGHNAKVSLNLPLAEGLAGVQVSAFGRREGGFTKNVTTGDTGLGRVDARGGAVSLLVTPGKDLQFTLRLLSQEAKTYGPMIQANLVGTSTPAFGEREFSGVFTPRFKSRLDLAEGAMQYQTPVGTLTGSVGHVKSTLLQQSDYTAYALLLNVGASARADPNVTLKKDTAEVRLATRRFGGFEGLAGLFYTREASVYDIAVVGLDSSGAPVQDPGANIVHSTPAGTYTEAALFGSVTYYLAEDIDVGAGLRRAKNKQDYTVTRSGMLSNANNRFNVIQSEDSSTTWQVVARYRPLADWSLYARVATGYRPGGPQTNVLAPNRTFDPDTVKSYELGSKAYLLGRRLSLDLSVYRIDWNKVQLNAVLGGFVVVGNAGRAKVDGVEAQINWQDRGGLSLGATLGYNRARLTELGSTTASSIGAALGDPLPASPKLTASLFGDYAFGSFAGARWSAGATVRHRGEANSSYTLLPSPNPNYVMPAFTTLDARLKVEWDRYSLRLGIDNLTDRNAVVAYGTTRLDTVQPINSNATVMRPRTYSITLGVAF